MKSICYNDFNLPISRQDENNIVTTYRYNAAGLIDQVSQTHEGTTLSHPLGYPDGWNALAYCNNGVTGAVDLWGGRKTHEEHGVGQCEVSWQNSQDPVIKYGLIYYGTCNGSSISCKTIEIIQQVTGPQYPIGSNVFGSLSDVAPDRWGRKLILRRGKRLLLESDYVLGVCDLTQLGAIRFI